MPLNAPNSMIIKTFVVASFLAASLPASVHAAGLERSSDLLNAAGTKSHFAFNVLSVANGVNGYNVVEVYHSGGRFVENGGGRWTELGNDGAQFNFVETGRDEWSVYLNDPGRNLQIQLDLHRRQILWGQNNGPKSPLYNMTDAFAAQGQIGEATSQEVVDYNCNEGIPLRVIYTNTGNVSTANVTHDGFQLGEFNQIPSGSGSAYSNGRYTLYTKGREAVLQWDGITDVCYE